MQHVQDPHTIDQRLTDLEIKFAYTEDLLEQLDSVIVRQQRQIDDLIRTIIELRQPSTRSEERRVGKECV